MKDRGGFALGVLCGAMLVGGLGAGAGMLQPVKTQPVRQSIEMKDVPEVIRTYIRGLGPNIDLDKATATSFATGATTIYRVEENDGEEVLDASFTQRGVLLSWKRQHTGATALVPGGVTEGFQEALPGGKVLGCGDFDSLMYMYRGVIEKDGKYYKALLSSVDGLEIEEMAEWEVSVYKRRLGAKDAREDDPPADDHD